MKRIIASILSGLILTGCSCTKQESSSSYISEVETTIELTTQETTTATTTTTEQTTANETTTTEVTTEQTVTTIIFTTESETTKKLSAGDNDLQNIGTFKGTYYTAKAPCKGGSGRTLKSCSIKSDSYKGSIASRYIY